MKLYDIIDLSPASFPKRAGLTAKRANPSPGSSRNTVSLSGNSVTPNAASVNTPTSINFGVSSQDEMIAKYLEKYGTMRLGGRVQHMDGSGRESGTWQAPKQTAENTYTRRTMQTFANAPSLSPADRQIAMEMVDNVGQYVRISQTTFCSLRSIHGD